MHPRTNPLRLSIPGLTPHSSTIVYLKSKGINPETHPVIGELQRIKSYYGKIQQAENPEQRASHFLSLCSRCSKETACPFLLRPNHVLLSGHMCF